MRRWIELNGPLFIHFRLIIRVFSLRYNTTNENSFTMSAETLIILASLMETSKSSKNKLL